MTISRPVGGQLLPQIEPPLIRTAEARRVEKAARQFETQLLASVLAALESSVGADETGASEQYRMMATQGLASAWAAAGGVGIARLITHALSHTAKPDLPSGPTALPVAPLPSTFR